MARGRPRADLPANDPDQWVHLLQRSRARLMPDLVPALLAWLTMHERLLTEERSRQMSLTSRLPPAARSAMVASLDDTIRGLRCVADLVTQPFRRVDWYDATARIVKVFSLDPTAEPTAPDAGPDDGP